MESDSTFSFLALGDSYTVGTGVRADERWPDELLRQLRRQHGTRSGPLEIIARNGWRTDNLAIALDRDSPGTSYDLVSLLIGVNDQYQGFDAAGYAERFTRLLDRSLGYAGSDTARVLVVSIPDYSYTPFGGGRRDISEAIDEFNAVARRITESRGVAFYNITEISREGFADPTLVSEDRRLHPSAKQYARWVEEVLLSGVARQLGV